MATLTIPALADIGTRLRTAFRAYLPGTDAMVEPNNLSVTGKAFALGMFDAYQRIKWLYRQLFASTADRFHLVYRHGADYGLTLKPSSAATGSVVVAQLIPEAQTVPAGVTFIRDDGVQFVSTAVASAANGSVTLQVQAQSTGAATNCAAGESLTLVQQPAVPNLADTGAVDANGLGGGADEEATEAFRARVLARKRFTPQAGAPGDYERWATAVPGVTRAYASRFSSDCTYVSVWPLFDGLRANGIPQPGDLAPVIAAIESQRPVGAIVRTLVASAQAIDVTIANLSPNTPATQAAIAAALADAFFELGAVSTTQDPLTFYAEWISGAIRQPLPDAGTFTLVAPPADVFVALGSLPILGTVTFE